jgi:hypothetical protein
LGGSIFCHRHSNGENTIVPDPGANQFVGDAAVEDEWPGLPPASVLLSLLEIPHC